MTPRDGGVIKQHWHCGFWLCTDERERCSSCIFHTSGLILTCQGCNSLTANHTHVKKCPSSPRNWWRVNWGELIKDYNQLCRSCPSAALFNGCICKQAELELWHPVWFLKKSPPSPLFVWINPAFIWSASGHHRQEHTDCSAVFMELFGLNLFLTSLIGHW